MKQVKKQRHRYVYIHSVAKGLAVLCTKNYLKVGGRITKLQSVEEWHIFYETPQDATYLNFQFLEVVRQHILGAVDIVLLEI